MNSGNNLWILRFRLNIMRRRPHPALNWIFKSIHDSNYSFVLMWFNINLSPFTGFSFRCFSPFYASDQWDFCSSLFFRPLCALWRSRIFLTGCVLWEGLVCCWPEVGGATADEGGRGPTSSGLECQMDTPGTWLSCSSECPHVANDITRSNYVFQTAIIPNVGRRSEYRTEHL